ncbi:hypothetical protein ECE49_02445 [Helicobacter pylori]|nr:hypothetical protein ECE49_02445 [Helicobacter pylori]
MKTIITKVV